MHVGNQKNTKVPSRSLLAAASLKPAKCVQEHSDLKSSGYKFQYTKKLIIIQISPVIPKKLNKEERSQNYALQRTKGRQTTGSRGAIDPNP